jgi:DNA-binding response OmpR family regulator
MHQAKILVADDSRTIRTIVYRTLSAAGFDVSLARDGKEAVAVAQRDRPDLAILDIQMPEMDGYTACDQILALSQPANNIPIVFLTKETANHLHTLGSELGAYLQKPVCEETLVRTVRELLASRVSTDVCVGTL